MKKSFLYLIMLAIRIFSKVTVCEEINYQSKMVYRLIVLVCLMGSIFLIGGNATATDKYQGVSVNVLTAPAHVAYAVELRAKEFMKMTGAKVTVQRVKKYNDLYKIMLADFSSVKNYYNAAVYPAMWMPDFADPGYIEDLTERIQTDIALVWSDIVPFFRKFIATYKERAFCLPLDGDFQMLYYRSDILSQADLTPPTTWEEYIEVAKALHGQDMNGDGTPDYGSCISRGPGYEAYWYFLSIAAAFIQSKGTSQGIFFDTRNMKPLVNNEAFEKALDVYVELMKYGPPNELNLDTDELHQLFIEGRCGTTIAWGDIGIMAINPDSKVKDRVGATILPGSRQVLDHTTGELVDCDDSHCPYAIDGINHAPFAAFGGWAGSINASGTSKTRDAAYAFLSYMAQPKQSNVDVTIGKTGCNPYRFSQIRKADLWMNAGMSKEAVDFYLGAMGKSLNSPNMVLDLKIPQSFVYLGEVLDRTLNRLLTGKITKKQAMVEIEKGWEETTNKIGRNKQLKSYLLSLGRKAK